MLECSFDRMGKSSILLPILNSAELVTVACFLLIFTWFRHEAKSSFTHLGTLQKASLYCVIKLLVNSFIIYMPMKTLLNYFNTVAFFWHSSTVISISAPHSPVPQPSLPPSPDPTQFGFVHVSFIVVPKNPVTSVLLFWMTSPPLTFIPPQ